MVVLSACTTIQPLSVQNRQRIKTIKLNPVTVSSSSMYYYPPSMAIGGLFALPAYNRGLGHFEKDIYANHIDSARIFRAQFLGALDRNTHFKVVKSGAADATINLNIYRYGFSIPHGLTSYVQPTLNVDANMCRKGQVVWHYKNRSLVVKGTPHYRTTQLVNDPDLIKQAWNKAAYHLSNTMTKTM